MPTLLSRLFVSNKHWFSCVSFRREKVISSGNGSLATARLCNANKALTRFCKSILMLFSLLVFHSSAQASCVYEVLDNSNPHNWTAQITVTNTGTTDITGWDVTWTYPDSSIVHDTPSFTKSGSSPTFTATVPTWNTASYTLSPGEQVIIPVSGGGNASGEAIPSSLVGAACAPPETVVTSAAPSTISSTSVTPDANYCEALNIKRGVHLFTVPANVTELNFKGWGAGGHSDFNNQTSGPGGYAEASISVTPGDQYTIIVGGRGGFAGGANGHGFGGVGFGAGHGGGLTGIFTGTTAVTSAEQSRAVVIAGGGGGSDRTIFLSGSGFTTQNQLGGSGGDPVNGGGQLTMKGADGSTIIGSIDGTFPRASGGGAGGYYGGALHRRFGNTEGYAGNGGTNFINTALTVAGSAVDMYTPEFDYIPPNTSDAHYESPLGEGEPGSGAGNDGLAIIQYNDGTCGEGTLTLVKTVVTDSGGPAAADTDWTLEATDGGSTTISGVEGDAAITNAVVPVGTYTLSETGGPAGYTQTSLVCSGAADTDPSDGLAIAVGEDVVCTFTNDDDMPPIMLPTEIQSNTCALLPSTEFWQRRAEWSSNGSDPLAPDTIDPAVFSRVESFVPGPGITGTNASSSQILIDGVDQATFTAAYQAGDYIDYEVETAAGLANTWVLSGVSENGGRSGPDFKMDLLMSDDNFATAVRIFTGFEVDGEAFDWITNVEQQYLKGGTEYKFRVVFYDLEFPGQIAMDDFSLAADNCADMGDAVFTGTTPLNGGSHTLPSVRDYFIGAVSPDAEYFVTADDNTSGDVTAGEEDITFPTFGLGQTATFNVPVTGAGGLLNAWIDWNANEIFEASEKVAIDATVSGGGASGTIPVTVTVPAGANVGTTWARLRWSPNTVTNATDDVAEGEIEDHEITVIEPVSTPPDVVARPASCGAFSHAGWSVPGGPFINANILFGSGDPDKDPYQYAGLSRDANGKIVTSYGTPTHSLNGASGNPTRFEIETHNNTSTPYVSEYHLSIYRLEGTPGATDTVTFASAGGADNITAWIEDTAGAVIANSTSDASSDDGWIFGTFNNASLTFVYPADGVVYLYGGLFDPSGNYGGTEIDYLCPPTLTLEKTVINDGSGVAVETDWTLEATDGTTTISGTEGSAAITSATLAAGTYQLSESGPSGYTQTSLTCSGAADTDLSDGLTLADGEEVTCTFVNNDVAEDTIALPTQCAAWNHKGWVTNAVFGLHDRDVVFGSGDAANDPYIYAGLGRDADGRVVSFLGTAGESLSGTIGTKPGTDLAFSANNVVGHESEYHVTVYRLEGTAGSTQSISLTSIGGFEHTAYWIEDTAGNVLGSQDFRGTWPTSSGGDGDTLPASITYPADGIVYFHVGQFDPSQAYGRPDITGYTCPPLLTLEKTVINDDTGTSTDTDWTLSATDGTTTISGVTGDAAITSATVPAGTYTLSESGPAGYTQTSLSCTGAADADPSDGLALAAGENVVCTFENDDDTPQLTISKSVATLKTDADTSTDVTLGDTLEYVVTMTNTGTIALNNVVVSDAQLTPSSITCPTVLPSATCVLTGEHVVTLAEADAGVVVNTADVVSDELPTSEPSNTVNTPVETDPSLDITKADATLLTDADSSGDVTLGDTLEYVVTATNDGNETLTNVVVSDTQLTPNSFTCATLASNATCVLTGTHVVTLAEADAGVVVNTAGVVSDELPTSEPSNTVNTPVETDPSLDITKAAATLLTDADSSGDVTLDDTLEYVITATNDGNETLTNVVVTDSQLTPSSTTCATLAPNATCVLTGTHLVTLTEVDAGEVVNTAGVVSDEIPTSEPSNTVVTPTGSAPSLAIVKADATLLTDADSSGDVTLGDTLEYAVTATNDGNETLTNVVVTDSQLTPSSTTCATLVPNATCVLTGTHVVTLAEADAGMVVNTAGVVSDELPASEPSNTVNTPVETDPSLDITKADATLLTDADSSGDVTLGDILEYVVTATNDGNETLTNVVVTDTQLMPSSTTCATLAPNATCVLTGTHVVTLAEADAGVVVNTAGVVSDELPTSEPSNTVNTPVETDPSLDVTKAAATLLTDADSSGDVTLGDTLEYVITATNDGNETLSNVVVTDTQLTPSSMTCAALAPNVTCVLTGTHVVTLAEVDAGEVVNTAGVVSDEIPTSVPSNTVVTPIGSAPSLAIVKSDATLLTDADSSGDVTLGDTLEYVVTTTNDGNETLTNVVVTDTQLTPSSTTCATLAPNATCVLTGAHVVTLAEADAGIVVNTAGVVSDELPTSEPSNTVNTPVETDPSLAITKAAATLSTDADSSGDVTLGDTLEYVVTATNDGNETLTNVVVSDAQLTPSSTICATLAPNATCVLTGTHVVTLAEADAGEVVNTAGVVSDELPTSVSSNTVVTPIGDDPALTIIKSNATLLTDADSSGDVTFGDTLEYVITATNNGNVSLNNVVVSDSQLVPSSVTCSSIAPTMTCTLTGTHTVTLAEADAGEVINTAAVVSDDTPVSMPSNTVNTPVETDPSLDITKAAATLLTDADGSGDITLGDTLEYVVTATNDGNETLTNVVVTDAQLIPNSFTCATLAPNATCVLTGTHVVTLTEADAGIVVNTAGVVSDELPTSESSNTVNTPVETAPSLAITKAVATLLTDADSSGDVTLGDTLEYVITATNDGNETLTNVVVTDTQLTPSSMTCASLAPNATCVLTGTHVVTLAEADAGVVVNTAGVVSDELPTSEQSNTVNTPVETDPSLAITKAAATLLTDADSSGDVTLGDTLEYVVTATNDGNETLTNVVVTDTQLTPSSTTCTTLAPNATCVLTGTHVVTLAEVDAGEVVNTAGVVSDEIPTSVPSNTVVTPIGSAPSLAIVKADATLLTDADSSGDVTLGDTLEYVVAATNDGNETLTNVVVTDTQLTPSSTTCATLAPNATCVLTGTHIVTLAEANAGEVVNTAGVVSDELPVSESSNTVVTPLTILITPDDESGAAVSGTPSTPVANVTADDLVNGQPAQLGSGGNATITESGAWPTGITLDPATGAVTTDATVQPGVYTMDYELCDLSSPTPVCETATVTITVTGDIIPDDEAGTAVSGTPSTPVANVTDGDLVNGQPAQLGSGGNATITESGTWPTGITLDPATGAVTTDAAVQPGVYTMDYELCDLSSPTPVCETATVTITVAGDIIPDDEAGTAISGTPSTPVANVTDGDLVNGQPAQLGSGGNATITESDTWPTGFTLDPATGAVTTDAAVQPGVYTMDYELCDLSSPTPVCETATVTITVAGDIIPDDEAGTAISGTPSTPVANVTAGDLVNGQPAQLGSGGNATITESGTWPTGITLDPATGAVTTDATVQPGVYTMDYELCDLSSPTPVCETATVTITVTGDIIPDDEAGTAVSGTPSTPVANVTDGDLVNGQPAQLGSGGNATITESGTWPTGITLDPATGAVTSDAAVQPGVYTMDYELCDLSSPTPVCETATVTITVSGDIIPDDEAGTAVSGTPSTPVANVTDGDLVNGQPAQLGSGGNATITESGTWPTGITLDPATGAVTTDAAVQPGVYTMDYELCDLSSPTPNCETATITITVSGDIIPDDESGTTVAGIPATPVADVTNGDLINGQPAQLGANGNATIAESGTWPAGITLDPATGAVSTDATVPAGTYTMQYELCDLSTPANCETATITIVIEPNLPPVVEDDSSAPNQPLGQPVTVATVGNDSDPENKLDPTSVKIVDAAGNPVTTLVVPGEGTWVVDPVTGAITFTPQAGFVGDPAPINYTVSDQSGNVSNVATVTVDYEEPVSITGTVWVDTNQDGTVDAGEERRAGWTLQIKDNDGNVVATAVTDAQGNYSITGLIPDQYTIEFYDADGNLISSQRTESVLISGQSIDVPLPLEPEVVANPDLDDNSLLLSKSVNKKQISVGDQVYYTIRAENLTGGDIAFDISDDLPAGFKIVSNTVKVTHAGTDGTFGTADDTYPASTTTGTDPVRFGPMTLGDAEKVQVGYLVKIGTGAKQGSSVNTAQAFAAGSTTDIVSNIATASVEMIADTVIDQSTLIGKVFHDRDGDGYQDPANVTGLTVKSDYFGWNSLHLGNLNSRTSVLDDPAKYRKVVRMPWGRKNDFKVTTEQGTVITVNNQGQVSESHVGAKAKGWTGQDVRVTTRRIQGVPTQTPVAAMRKPSSVMDVLEITMTNHGIHEEGIAGVRLATVKGLVIETDGYGRYNIPDVNGGLRNSGRNFIIKVDLATLPRGARMTTENPRVLRLTGAALEEINFGVKLLEQRAGQTVQVSLNSVFFKESGHHIRKNYYKVMDDIADKIKQYGQGHITVVATQSGMRAQDSSLLAKRRVHSVKTYLQKKLGHQLMMNVKVEVNQP